MQRGLQRGLGRRMVADLADHDDLGVLTHEEPQAGGQVELHRRIDLRLRHARERPPRSGPPAKPGSAAIRRIGTCRHLAETGVDRGRLSAARGAGRQDRPRRFLQELPQDRQRVRRQPQVVQPLIALRPGKQPHHGLFAVKRGKGADPHLHVVLRRADAALLGHVSAVGQQLGPDLQPGDDVGAHRRREARAAAEHAVDAKPRLQPVGRGLQVQIAGPPIAACGQQAIDDLDGVLRILRIQLGNLPLKETF